MSVKHISLPGYVRMWVLLVAKVDEEAQQVVKWLNRIPGEGSPYEMKTLVFILAKILHFLIGVFAG